MCCDLESRTRGRDVALLLNFTQFSFKFSVKKSCCISVVLNTDEVLCGQSAVDENRNCIATHGKTAS